MAVGALATGPFSLGRSATLLRALHPSGVNGLLPALALVLALAACGERPVATASLTSTCAPAPACTGAACPKPTPAAEAALCEIPEQ